MIKRLIDIVVSLCVLIALSPVLLWVWIKVKRALGAPVLYRQIRPGHNGEPFIMLKFRTMRNEVNSDGVQLPDHLRLNAFGVWLRSTSLDELPELWNVIKGDMSLVGPRPLLMQYLERYTPEQARRHNVRPGITGWAQVNGRNAISWEEKFALDVWYVDNQSLALDVKILLMTISSVLKRTGISSKDYSTMPEFKGTHKVNSDYK